jgi:hypothetical protein
MQHEVRARLEHVISAGEAICGLLPAETRDLMAAN